jgi:hypothetical protein
MEVLAIYSLILIAIHDRVSKSEEAYDGDGM